MLLQIIIPAYNCLKTLSRTLDSLVAQTNQNFSVILVDDCSTQDLLPLVNNYADKLNIKYVRNTINVGCGMSRQVGINESTADYITFLDSDDWLLPDAVELWQTELIKSRPEVLYSVFIPRVGSFWLSINAEFPLYMCHGKCYSKKFLTKYNIEEIPEVHYNDDLYFNFLVFSLAENIAILYDITYVYMITRGSITQMSDYSDNARAEYDCMYANIFKKLKEAANITTLDRYNQVAEPIRKFLYQLRDSNPGNTLSQKYCIR